MLCRVLDSTQRPACALACRNTAGVCGSFSHQNLKKGIFLPTYLWTRPEMDTEQRRSLCAEETSCQRRKKNYVTGQNSGLWAATNLTRHGSGFPLLSTFGPKLFLLIWYLHISKVACLRFLNSVGFLPSRFFLFYTRTGGVRWASQRHSRGSE